MKHTLDLQHLRDLNRNACRECFGDLFAKHPEEVFYGVGLYTIDDATGPIPSASTESAFELRKRKLLDSPDKIAWLKENGIDVQESLLGDERWCMQNWEHAAHYPEPFYPVCELIESAAEDSSIESHAEFKTLILAAMVAALYDLRRDDFFDSASTTLFCSIHASCDDTWLTTESARILNSPRQFHAFEKECLAYIQDSDSIVDTRRREEMVPLFLQHLNSCGIS